MKYESVKRFKHKDLLLSWTKQIEECLGLECLIEYLVPDFEQFNRHTNNYQKFSKEFNKHKDDGQYDVYCVDQGEVEESKDIQKYTIEYVTQALNGKLINEQNEVYLGKNRSKPLDLSKNSMKNKQRLDLSGDKLQQPMIVPKRRNYSKEELDKAIIDIQSGRIGTRRASVLYGIPRSTLRNKVFRLTNNKLPRNATCKPSMTGFNKEKLLNELCLKMIVEKLTKKNGLLPSKSMHVEPTQMVTEATNTSAFVQFNLNKVMFKLLDDLLSQKTSPPSASSSSLKTQTAVKLSALSHSTLPLNPNTEQTGTNDHNGNADNHDSVNKQKRAKRGQYRRYELDQLNKAVDAVLNGMMSVHKAGSHFGVPHSTLEYKVKEKTTKNLDLKVPLSL